jgi:AcrR family transcriptional regulator
VTNHRLPETDGRHRRSARTRQHLIEAYLDLLKENPNGPTADKIAKRAGCATRSVYQHFSDLQTLGLAAADYALRQASAQAVAREVDSDRLSRIRSQVETRSATCDRWLPLWRSMLHNQHDSEELLRRVECTRDTMFARLELMYQPELSARSEGERREVLIALEALTDFETWGRMRQRHNLSVKAAREVWINAIDRILPPTPWPEQQADAAIESPAEAGVTDRRG